MQEIFTSSDSSDSSDSSWYGDIVDREITKLNNNISLPKTGGDDLLYLICEDSENEIFLTVDDYFNSNVTNLYCIGLFFFSKSDNIITARLNGTYVYPPIIKTYYKLFNEISGDGKNKTLQQILDEYNKLKFNFMALQDDV